MDDPGSTTALLFLTDSVESTSHFSRLSVTIKFNQFIISIAFDVLVKMWGPQTS